MARKGLVTRSFTLPDGTRKYVYGTTKKEAEEKLLQAKMQMAAGVDLSRHDTFGEFAQMWFNTFKKGKVASQTEIQYRSELNTHIMPQLARYPMSKITPIQCATIFTKMTEAGKSKGTQQNVYQLMKKIFASAVENGVIAKSPLTDSVQPGGRPQKKRKALTPAQIEALKKASCGTKMEEFVQIALGTGLRMGEIYGLHWEDVDMEAGEIFVHRTIARADGKAIIQDHPKTDAGVRTVPFDLEVQKAFQRLWLQRQGPLVFRTSRGTIMSQPVHQYHWNKCTKAAGLEGITAHYLRHTCITNWFDAGLDIKEVQYLAGHEHPNVTMDIYTDYLADKRYDETKAKIQHQPGKSLKATGA